MTTQSTLTKTVTIQYVAMLREQSQRSREVLQTDAASYLELYQQVKAKYGFPLAVEDIKVAVNHEFCDLTSPVDDHAFVIFIPPVCGG
ncbi:MoaD/ThiS family protein [Synechococcus sp. H55.5]|uniref:MoaD/ThiS family protein n=1 Tax=unclassified Synechococcus TaxID=2626047 RepID=UPI0039C1458E